MKCRKPFPKELKQLKELKPNLLCKLGFHKYGPTWASPDLDTLPHMMICKVCGRGKIITEEEKQFYFNKLQAYRNGGK